MFIVCQKTGVLGFNSTPCFEYSSSKQQHAAHAESDFINRLNHLIFILFSEERYTFVFLWIYQQKKTIKHNGQHSLLPNNTKICIYSTLFCPLNHIWLDKGGGNIVLNIFKVYTVEVYSSSLLLSLQPCCHQWGTWNFLSSIWVEWRPSPAVTQFPF